MEESSPVCQLQLLERKLILLPLAGTLDACENFDLTVVLFYR
jgi:hypothetical protein